MPDVSKLVKKTDYDAKILDIESKYITTNDCNTSTKEIVDNIIKSKNLVNKYDIGGFIKNTDLDKKNSTIINNGRIKSRARLNNKITKI